MKRVNTLQIVLELIVVIGCFVIGGAILLCQILDFSITKTLVGLITIAIGSIGIIEYLTYKVEVKLKSFQSLVANIVLMVVGLLFIIFAMENKVFCTVWGITYICFSLAKGFTAAIHILKQPLLNIFRIVASIVFIVFSAILMAKNIEYVHSYLIVTTVILLSEAVILLIEFIIHRFQN